MSLEQYNVSTNPFLALSKGIGSGDRRSSNLGHALILQGVHHAQVMEHLDRSHQLEEQSAAATREHELTVQGRQHAFESSLTAAKHGHQKELMNMVNKGAETGTGIKLSAGDFSAEYTKKKPKQRKMNAPIEAAPVAPVAEKKPKLMWNNPITGKIEPRPEGMATPKPATKKSAPKKRK
jgi:hypothetical protein